MRVHITRKGSDEEARSHAADRARRTNTGCADPLVCDRAAGKSAAAYAPATAFSVGGPERRLVWPRRSTRSLALISFSYTRCSADCAAQEQRLLAVRDALRTQGLLGTQMQLLTISIDPAFDTPTRLKQHATFWQADASVWRLLTGYPREIKALVGGELGVYYAEQPGAASTSASSSSTSAARFVMSTQAPSFLLSVCCAIWAWWRQNTAALARCARSTRHRIFSLVMWIRSMRLVMRLSKASFITRRTRGTRSAFMPQHIEFDPVSEHDDDHTSHELPRGALLITLGYLLLLTLLWLQVYTQLVMSGGIPQQGTRSTSVICSKSPGSCRVSRSRSPFWWRGSSPPLSLAWACRAMAARSTRQLSPRRHPSTSPVCASLRRAATKWRWWRRSSSLCPARSACRAVLK
ncbi:hypothetical protein HC891_04530 [Candidatus Gracilibacteria bacterium]|nr:hypothetical protein [Candidatus Gracilibacteria bacterium]